MYFEHSLKIIKAELLCYGLRIDDSTKSQLVKVNSFALEKTLVHALHIIIENTIINVCVSEKFCTFSPYELKYDGRFLLTKDGMELCYVDIIGMPAWCRETIDGFLIGKYLRPHSNNCISCSPILTCGYQLIGKGCKFCSLSEFGIQTKAKTIIPEKSLAKMIHRAMIKQNYELNFSAGTLLTKGKSAEYYISVLKELRTLNPTHFPNVSIEMAPPDEESVIDEMALSGVKALIMNIEIVNPILRKEMCPGKGTIPLEHYYSMMQKAVHVMGRGNVSSVLLAGIQPHEDIIKMGSELISLGVIPTIMPFKPLDNCEMENFNITDPKELIYINDILGEKLSRARLDPNQQCGCTKCGGCSIEALYFKVDHL